MKLFYPNVITIVGHGKNIAGMLTDAINSWIKDNSPQNNAEELTFMLTAY